MSRWMIITDDRAKSLAFHNIGRDVNVPSSATQHNKVDDDDRIDDNIPVATINTKRTILEGIYGEVHPGQVLAILGPSGCGATSLLNILSGRARSRPCDGIRVRGCVRLNGIALSHDDDDDDRESIAFVPKWSEYSIYANQTVVQAVSFEADLLLHDDVTKQDKVAAVNFVLWSMYMTLVKDKLVYMLTINERKRLAIAIALLTNPPVLIMDDPTAGLDPASAALLLGNIFDIATHQRRAIIISLSSPPLHTVFDRFDHVLILANGRSAYAGHPYYLLSYFTSLGYPCPYGASTASYVVDLFYSNWLARDYLIGCHSRAYPRPSIEQEAEDERIVEDERKVRRRNRDDANSKRANGQVRHHSDEEGGISMRTQSPSDQEEGQSSWNDGRSAAASPVPGQAISSRRKSSSINASDDYTQLNDASITDKHDAYSSSTSSSSTSHLHPPSTFPSSFSTQFCSLYSRYNGGYIRYVVLQPANLFQWLLLTALVCLAWWRTAMGESNLPDRTGFCFFTLSFVGFASIFDGAQTLPIARYSLNQDRAAGKYRLSAYFLARFVAETPGKLLLPTVYTIIVFYATGVYDASIAALFGWIVTIWLTYLAGESIGLFAGSIVLNLSWSLAFSNVCILGLLIVSGFYVHVIPSYMTSTQWLSFIKYAFDSMLLLEFEPTRMFVCEYGQWALLTCSPQYYPYYVSTYGQSILTGQSIRDILGLSSVTIIQNWLALVAFIVVFRIGAYACFRRFHYFAKDRLY